MMREMNSMKELLHTYEQSMERKDQIVSNLTAAVQRHRDKLELMRKFSDWRLKQNDAKREVRFHRALIWGAPGHWKSVSGLES